MSEYGHFHRRTNKKLIESYEVRTKHGEFSVNTRDKRIIYYNRLSIMRRNACIDNGLVLPDEIPPFDSFIHAVQFMKQNAEALR